MSLEQATAFIDRVISDGEFSAKVEQYKGNPESVMAEAKAAGYEFTTDEISQAYRNHEQTPNLSDKQLDEIAGGGGWFDAGVAVGASAGACL